jgi:hypothetical protein
MIIKKTVASGVMVILLGVLWVAGSAIAHPPEDSHPGSGEVRLAGVTAPLLHYQGLLTDPGTGEPVDGSHTMTFRLYDSESGPTALWMETEDVSVENGVFSTVLGDVEPLDQGLFDGRELWLGVKVGADAEATPRQRILPVAYALSLVPGAVMSTTGDHTALALSNTGSGDALQVEGATVLDGNVSLTGHSDDAALVVTNTLQDGIWATGGDGWWDAGVVGHTSSISHGMGVQGHSYADSGESYGVWGLSGSPEGAGVKGIGQNGSHGVYGETGYDAEWYEANGVMGYSIYTDTAGVYGESEYGNGVFGKANSDHRAAVVGWNEGAASGVFGTSDHGHGVSGETWSDADPWAYAGVYGFGHLTGTFGVLGESEYGRGVEGRTWELDNPEPAVHGYSTGGGPGVVGYSQNNHGVQGQSDAAHGVYGQTDYDAVWYEANGVMGYSIYTYTAGVYGESVYGNGVIGIASSPWKSGVVGFGTYGPGVSGHSQADDGVEGRSDSDHGVYGETSSNRGGYEWAGVYGRSTYSETFGVLGESDYGIGVEGKINEPDNTNPAVIGYNSGGGEGVIGYSENSAGVYGDGATYGGHFVSAGGTALRADGDVRVYGDLAATGRVSGGDGTALPIAYGFVSEDGSLVSGSRNVESSWDDKTGAYAIYISDYEYLFWEYCTIVTLAFPCFPAPCAAQVAGDEGLLMVYIFDATGQEVQANFQFVTYSP